MPDSETSRRGWAHTEVVIAADGSILTGDCGEPRVLVFAPDGSLVRSFDVPVTEVHGMTLVPGDGSEVLWIADIGMKNRPELNYRSQPGPNGGQVIAVDLRGHVLARLDRPDMAIYEEAPYAPTIAAIDTDNGDVWVGDGYGQSYVHRYDDSGTYLGSLSGEEDGAAGRFKCPHNVYVDRRKTRPELYVADRGHRRIQVYDMNGRFKRSFGAEFMTGPTDLTPEQDRLLVVEYIDARITVLDVDDQVVGYLGENKGAYDRDDWPNSKLADGTVVRNDHLTPGKFNSAHSVAVDREGNLFVSEFLVGGRLTKLARL